MASLGKIVGLMIVISVVGGVYYYYQGDLNLFSPSYKIKIISNTRWDVFVSYIKEGKETMAWLNGKNNKTYEFDYKVTGVSASREFDTNKPLNPFVTIEIYKGKKLEWTDTSTQWQTIEWNSGIRITG